SRRRRRTRRAARRAPAPPPPPPRARGWADAGTPPPIRAHCLPAAAPASAAGHNVTPGGDLQGINPRSCPSPGGGGAAVRGRVGVRRAPDRRHSERNALLAARPALAGLPRVARARPPDAEDGLVRDEMVRRGVGDLHGDHVAGADGLVRRREVHEPVVGRAARQAPGLLVLAALPLGHEDLHGPAELLAVLLPGDLLLEGDQPL